MSFADWFFRRRDRVLDELLSGGPNACRPCGGHGTVSVMDRSGELVPDICRPCHGTGKREQTTATASRRKR